MEVKPRNGNFSASLLAINYLQSLKLCTESRPVPRLAVLFWPSAFFGQTSNQQVQSAKSRDCPTRPLSFQPT